MNNKLVALASLFFLLSCNTNDKKNSDAVKTETQTIPDSNTNGSDIEAQKKALNEQSKACIALMNSLEEDKNAAVAAGKSEVAGSLQVRLDSAATENVRIGQKLMALEK